MQISALFARKKALRALAIGEGLEAQARPWLAKKVLALKLETF